LREFKFEEKTKKRRRKPKENREKGKRAKICYEEIPETLDLMLPFSDIFARSKKVSQLKYNKDYKASVKAVPKMVKKLSKRSIFNASEFKCCKQGHVKKNFDTVKILGIRKEYWLQNCQELLESRQLFKN
jgi:hypothetical protein